jgi:hypothetical protein
MTSQHVHYDEPGCPHSVCAHTMEWIDFQLEFTTIAMEVVDEDQARQDLQLPENWHMMAHAA